MIGELPQTTNNLCMNWKKGVLGLLFLIDFPRLVASSGCPSGSYIQHPIQPSDPTVHQISTLAGNGTQGGSDGGSANSMFYWPRGMAVSPDGSWLYVADFIRDYDNQKIKKISTSTGHVYLLAGSGFRGAADGSATSATFYEPWDVSASLDGSWLYVADYANQKIRMVSTSSGEVSTLAGPFASVIRAVAVSPDGSWVYACGNSHKVYKVSTPSGGISDLAGSGSEAFADGTGASASFDYPSGLAVSPDGLYVYVADPGNSRIRKVSTSSGAVSTLATGIADWHIALSFDGSWLFVAQAGGGVLKISTSSGAASSLSGISSATDIGTPYGVSASPDGSKVYVADRDTYKIWSLFLIGCASCTAVSDCIDVVCTTSSDSQCNQCRQGYYIQNNGCQACSSISNCIDVTCSTSSDSQCTKCEEGYEVSNHRCELSCPAGFATSSLGTCIPCPLGSFKNESGVQNCTACATLMTTEMVASTSFRECLCVQGYTTYDGNACVACKPSTYKDIVGNYACRDCPSSTTSNTGSISVENCTSAGQSSECLSITPLTEVFKGGNRQPATSAKLIELGLSYLRNSSVFNKMRKVLAESCIINGSAHGDSLCWNTGTQQLPAEVCGISQEPKCD